jgi:rSAM/selenodomain-associated transferase 1
MLRDKLIVFVKAPRSGAVKTRLAAAIGHEAACSAYRSLVETLLGRIGGLRSVELRYAPDDAANEIAGWLRPGWETRPQGAGDLGERLQRAFAEGFSEGSCRIVTIGSDCPDMTSADVQDAWTALAEKDVVLGPATDGGYWLIGLRQPQPSLFEDMAWSTESVAQQTIERAQRLGLSTKVLRQLADVDSEADWKGFLARNYPNRI